jgi:hypothetical protein
MVVAGGGKDAQKLLREETGTLPVKKPLDLESGGVDAHVVIS